VKIEFEYLGEDIENKKRLMGRVTPMELFEIRQKLLTLDRKKCFALGSQDIAAFRKKGPLKIEEIEKLIRMTPDAVKMNIRKLKELSLISSNSKRCYSITPLSLKILGILKKK